MLEFHHVVSGGIYLFKKAVLWTITRVLTSCLTVIDTSQPKPSRQVDPVTPVTDGGDVDMCLTSCRLAGLMVDTAGSKQPHT